MSSKVSKKSVIKLSEAKTSTSKLKELVLPEASWVKFDLRKRGRKPRISKGEEKGLRLSDADRAKIDDPMICTQDEVAEALMTEWAIRGNHLKPREWLATSKGMPPERVDIYVSIHGEPAWTARRTEYLNKLSSEIVKRNIDSLIDHTDKTIKGSKLGLARAIEMLAKTPIREVKVNAEGKEYWTLGLTGTQLNECLNALAKQQEIYMRAMGLWNRNEGMTQFNQQINISSPVAATEGSAMTITLEPEMETGRAPDPRLDALTYDEVIVLIEAHRAANKKVDDEAPENG